MVKEADLNCVYSLFFAFVCVYMSSVCISVVVVVVLDRDFYVYVVYRVTSIRAFARVLFTFAPVASNLYSKKNCCRPR